MEKLFRGKQVRVRVKGYEDDEIWKFTRELPHGIVFDDEWFVLFFIIVWMVIISICGKKNSA